MNNGEMDELPPVRLAERVESNDDSHQSTAFDPVELMRDAVQVVVAEVARTASASAAQILGEFSLVDSTARKPSAPDLSKERAPAPTTDAFAQAPPAGGAETGGFNPNMFGD